MRLLIVGAVLIMFVTPAASQRIPAPFSTFAQPVTRPPAPPPQNQAEPPYSKPLLTAAGLGLVGFFTGAVAGHVIQGDCIGDFCEFEGFFYGAAAGGGLGLAVGAHSGNNRRGSLPLDLLVSGMVWGAGFATMSSIANHGNGDALAFVAIAEPITQLLATVAIERSSGRRRHPESQ